MVGNAHARGFASQNHFRFSFDKKKRDRVLLHVFNNRTFRWIPWLWTKNEHATPDHTLCQPIYALRMTWQVSRIPARTLSQWCGTRAPASFIARCRLREPERVITLRREDTLPFLGYRSMLEGRVYGSHSLEQSTTCVVAHCTTCKQKQMRKQIPENLHTIDSFKSQEYCTGVTVRPVVKRYCQLISFH
jgi:hypothetical protein